jgi:hypothetical protein
MVQVSTLNLEEVVAHAIIMIGRGHDHPELFERSEVDRDGNFLNGCPASRGGCCGFWP